MVKDTSKEAIAGSKKKTTKFGAREADLDKKAAALLKKSGPIPNKVADRTPAHIRAFNAETRALSAQISRGKAERTLTRRLAKTGGKRGKPSAAAAASQKKLAKQMKKAGFTKKGGKTKTAATSTRRVAIGRTVSKQRKAYGKAKSPKGRKQASKRYGAAAKKATATYNKPKAKRKRKK